MADADNTIFRRHLQKVLSSEQMEKSEASQKLLRYLAERALREETPKETEIAIDVFGRDASFNSAEESLVRVAVRALRRRLHDYYAGAGQHDEAWFDIPKGGYRLVCVPHEVARADASNSGAMGHGAAAFPGAAGHAPPTHGVIVHGSAGHGSSAHASTPGPEGLPNDAGTSAASAEPAVDPSRSKWLRGWAIAASVLLVVSIAVNSYLWLNRTTLAIDPATAQIAHSPLWSGIIDSDRPLMLVLGDGFMYTHVDPLTGRVQLVRDRAINSSEELRIFLAENPSIATGRGQRYTSMLQKSTTIGMASVLRLVSHPGREIEVRARDDLQVDDLQKYDIIYIGPLSRLGPLAGYYELQSRYRYDQHTTAIRDIATGKDYLPEGEVTLKHTEYALAARFVGPSGNHIVILTPGARNSGMLLTVRMFTTPGGLHEVEQKLRAVRNPLPDAFEALLSVTSFGQTDVASEVLAVHALPARTARAEGSGR